MALSNYSKDLLKFMYNLTFTPKINPPIHIAKFLETKGQNVSERTIKRWLRYLGNDISYYSRINYASLNLQTIYALIKKPKKGLLKAMPYAVAPFHGYNATNLERFLGVLCPIPVGKEKELVEFFETAKSLNLIEDYELFPYNQVADAYLPFHEICDLEGNFNFNKEYDIWQCPIESVNLSERGFEKVHQGVSVYISGITDRDGRLDISMILEVGAEDES